MSWKNPGVLYKHIGLALLLLDSCSGYVLDFFGDLDGKESTCNARDPGSIPRSGRFPRGGYGNPIQYSCLESSMDRGAWQAIVHRVSKNQIWLKWLSILSVTGPLFFFLPQGAKWYIYFLFASCVPETVADSINQISNTL